MVGSAVMSSEVRNSASRTALPLTNWAVTADAATVAITTERSLLLSLILEATDPFWSVTRHPSANPAECG